MRGFKRPTLSNEEIIRLEQLAKKIRGDILKMTTLAKSGHPGGAMSSLELFLVVMSYANIDPNDPDKEGRDYIVVSHGHTSAGVYATLGNLGFFDIDDAISYFRQAGSPFEGHIERDVPGIEWTTGNLGQGLSAGCGLALASKIKGYDNHVFVIMGDAEQAKGQVAEARRFAKKFNLNNLTVLIDYNRRQISGKTFEIMPVNIKENYESDGWKVVEADGHNIREIYEAIVECNRYEEQPCMVLAHTVMGKGVSFMEGNEVYHGKPLTEEQLKKALLELELENDLEKYKNIRESKKFPVFNRKLRFDIKLNTQDPILYKKDEKLDNRTALGKALWDVAKKSMGEEYTPIIAFDCDLMGSVKLNFFAKDFPDRFFETGVSEHNTATVSGAASCVGLVSVWGDFGVFGIDETYNQQRLNDINKTNLKLFVTHLGIDVGEDGKTHHCVDYVGTLKNLYSFKTIIPADPNQTDRVVRYVLSQFGNYAVGVGRSKLPIITDENGNEFFGKDYVYEYGKFDVLREGEGIAILVYGSTAHRGIKVHELLKDEGYTPGIINIASPGYITDELLEYLSEFDIIITYEDHNKDTGLAASLAQRMLEYGLYKRLIRFGLSDYATSGKANDVFDYMGISPEKVKDGILLALKEG